MSELPVVSMTDQIRLTKDSKSGGKGFFFYILKETLILFVSMTA